MVNDSEFKYLTISRFSKAGRLNSGCIISCERAIKRNGMVGADVVGCNDRELAHFDMFHICSLGYPLHPKFEEPPLSSPLR